MEIKKDFSWTFKHNNIQCLVRNVPTYIFDDGEEAVDLDVSIKITMIRDLMYVGEIPYEVDFDDVADFEINLNKLYDKG